MRNRMGIKGVATLGRALGIMLFFFFLVSGLNAQQVIENSDKPLSKNAGRVLALQPVFRITDQSGDFFFKGIWLLKVASNGEIYIFDYDQLLRFASDGKFIKNLLKKGQGPGEVTKAGYPYDARFIATRNALYIYDFNARKVIHAKPDGDYIDEFKIKSGYPSGIWGQIEDCLIFTEEEAIQMGAAKEAGLRDVEVAVLFIAKDGSSSKKILSLPKQVYEGPNFGKEWAPFDVAVAEDGTRLYVSHTCEYKIVQVDLKAGQIIRSFSRKYPRVDYVVKTWEKDFIKKYSINPKKYENDVLGVFVNKGKIWIRTSTKDEKKGYLIDVFDQEGKYVDNFFVSIPGSIVAVQDDCIYSTEQDKDGNMQVVKYEIAKNERKRDLSA
ncbi:MAG: hypothetical protein NTV82_13860 [Candidatus Aminicenantes bacterium]|nr:hypothetical protein [Candidatus Aminicenantes bacterium]